MSDPREETAEMPSIEQLRDELRRLLATLESPEPGLMAWQTLVADQLKSVHASIGKVLGVNHT